MRNLKKILALVLALIMSLSLMATASATDFKDDANVGETYRVAVDVLSDLSVFGGDQNGNFNPADPIRRSEVAAIIYRIATGDTGSEGHKSYTPYNQFADVVDGSWYAGYVTYCANAGYIKGRNDGNFHPNDNVTGYEVLAMILRAVGYDKNNEFVGSNWQTNTASIATQRGVLKNLTGTTLLSQPATREVVAELLFRSIMLQQVTWNANSLSYSDNGATLAKQNLNMEAVTGVVMGNERGNLEGTSVLAEGKTSLLVNGETSSRTLNVSTDLTVIGESRSAYIQGSKVLGGLLEDAGNDVKDNEGAETTVAKLRGGLNVTDAEHFINFADKNQDSSEWLIRYVVEKSSIAAGSAWENYLNGKLDGDNTLAVNTTQIASNVRQAYVNTEAKGGTAYEVTIKPETVINSYDKAIMKAIFYTADRNSSNPDQKPVEGYAYGEVYVGTSSLEDKSDIMSWNKFVETYLVTGQVKPITEVGNGNWLKIIDNNGDGKAEYVLHTIYTLDEVADSATRNGATTYFYNGIDSTAYTPIYLDGYTPAVGDIVLYAVIDGTYQIHKADTAKATFKAVNYKDRQATDVNGDVKEESDIINETRLPQTLTNVNENVEYDLYLDDYGYVRAYNNKTSYALVTEMYTTNKLNQGWVTGRALTAEVALAGENAIREYPVLNSSYYNNNNQNYNPFYTAEARYPIQNWNWVVNEAKWVQGEPNYLKPATHMLDMGQKQGNEFHFADSKFDGPSDNRTWTNVAEYIMGDNGINLYTAAKDNDNSQNPSTDYIQLAIRGTSAANPLYVINDVNYPKDTGDVNAQDNYVRAVDNTQFFAVDQYGSVRQWVGYRNTLKLDAEKNGIHAMYAVATNTNANRDSKPYWVANVIVIEVREFTESFESISLIYSNNTKISGDVKYLQALDNAKGEIGIIPNNIDIWNGQFTDYGFYGLTNIKVYDEENKLYTADVTSIHSSYGTNHATALKDCEDYKIFYGVVRSRLDENYYSDYITADVIDINGNVVKESVTLSLADFGGAYRIIPGANNYLNRYNEAVWMTLGGHASNRVNEGDRILWVEVPGNSTNKVGFIVDINDKYVPGSLHTWENAAFIETLRSKIALEQTTTPVDPVEAAKTAAVNALNAAAEAAKAGLDKDAPDYDAKVAAINAALEAALTKVNEADTAEAVETAKTEGLKAIEEAKGDVPASEHTLTITIGENVVSVTVTVTPKDGEAGEPIVVTAEETGKEITVPNGAKVEFATETAPGYVSSESNETVLENVTAGRELNFTAVEEDTTDKAIFTLDPNGTIWFWSTLNAADRTKVDVVLAAAGKDYAVGDEIALADFINLPEGQKPSLDGDFDLEFAPAEAAHYDYDKDVIVVDQNEKITVTLMCYNDGWKSDIDWGEGEGEDDGTWNPDGSGSELPQSRVARSMAASEKASRPQKGDVIPFYFWYVPVGKVPVSVTVNGEAVPSDKIELAKDYGNRGSAWQVPVVFTGGNVELVIKLGELKPELAVEVVDGDKNAVPTEDYTLEKTERKVTSGGKVTYNYTYTLTILDTGKWAYNQYLVTDEAGTGMGTAGSATTKAGVTTFTVSGLNKDGKLTITLKKPAAVTVTVSDKVALSVDKTSLLKGTSVEDATLTLSLNEGYQDGYRLPRTVTIKMGDKTLVISKDYTYNGTTGVIKFLAGENITDGITGDIVITANAIVEAKRQTLTVAEKDVSAGSENITYGPQEVTFGTEFTKLPVVKIVPKAGYAYPQSIVSAMMKTADNKNTTLTENTDYTYDKTTGEFKFVGSKKVTGNITITAAAAVPSVAELDVSINENGVVVVAKADGNAPTPANTYYMLADKTGDATLIEDLESILNGLFQNPQPKATELSKLIRLEDTTKPALTEKDNDSYVLVIELDQAKNNAAAKVLSAGAVKVTGITNAEKPQSELEVSDKHLTATREGDVITITAKDAGYYAPSVAGNTKVFIDGVLTTLNTDWNFRYDEATKSAIITLTTGKTGPVLIEVSAAELVRKLSVEIDIAGTVTIKDGDKTVANDAGTTFYVNLANNSMESQINALTNELSATDYLKTIGLSGTAGTGGDSWTNNDATDTNQYVLVYLLSGGDDGNVVAAGIAKNNMVADQPALDGANTKILSQAITNGMSAAGITLAELDLTGKTAVDISEKFVIETSSWLEVEASGSIIDVESDFVFVPTYMAGDVNLANWDALVASVNPAQHFQTISNLDEAKAIFGAGLDASCMKNGTLYIRVNEAAYKNNVVYYAVAVKANAGVAGDRNDAPVADGNVRVYVIADVKASQASGVESIELFDGSNTKTMTVGTTAMNLVEYFDFASNSTGENVAKITLKGSSSLTNEKVTVTATPAIFVKDNSASGSSHVMEYKSDAISTNTTVDVTIALNS